MGGEGVEGAAGEAAGAGGLDGGAEEGDEEAGRFGWHFEDGSYVVDGTLTCPVDRIGLGG